MLRSLLMASLAALATAGYTQKQGEECGLIDWCAKGLVCMDGKCRYARIGEKCVKAKDDSKISCVQGTMCHTPESGDTTGTCIKRYPLCSETCVEESDMNKACVCSHDRDERKRLHRCKEFKQETGLKANVLKGFQFKRFLNTGAGASICITEAEDVKRPAYTAVKSHYVSKYPNCRIECRTAADMNSLCECSAKGSTGHLCSEFYSGTSFSGETQYIARC